MKTFLQALCSLAVYAGLGFSARADSPAPVRVFRDLAYVTNGHERQKLDLYVPAAPKGPLLVWIHGGGWVSGSKDPPEGLPVLAEGYCLASIDYRFGQDAFFPAQIEDCKAAIRWLRAHAATYGYDPKRIAAMGASAGGQLTGLLASTADTREFDVGENLDQSSAIRCGIDQFGINDLTGWKPIDDNPMCQRTGARSILVQLLGDGVDEKKELAQKASPLSWVTKDCAPLYIQHGSADPLVGREQSLKMVEKLKACGVPVTFDLVEGAGHGGPEYWAGERSARLIAFLDGYLAKP